MIFQYYNYFRRPRLPIKYKNRRAGTHDTISVPVRRTFDAASAMAAIPVTAMRLPSKVFFYIPVAYSFYYFLQIFLVGEIFSALHQFSQIAAETAAVKLMARIT